MMGFGPAVGDKTTLGEYRRVVYRGSDTDWAAGNVKTLLNITGKGRLVGMYAMIIEGDRNSNYDIIRDGASIKHTLPGYGPFDYPGLHMDWLHGSDVLHWGVDWGLYTPPMANLDEALVSHHTEGPPSIWGYGATKGPIVEQYFDTSLVITIRNALAAGTATIWWTITVDLEIEPASEKFYHDFYYFHQAQLTIPTLQTSTISTGSIGAGKVTGVSLYTEEADASYMGLSSVDFKPDGVSLFDIRIDQPNNLLTPAGSAFLCGPVTDVKKSDGLAQHWGWNNMSIPITDSLDIDIYNGGPLTLTVRALYIYVRRQL